MSGWLSHILGEETSGMANAGSKQHDDEELARDSVRSFGVHE